ncbi:MAG: Calx-beta domain-containing protein, partial [Bdellovibrionales bacterium]
MAGRMWSKILFALVSFVYLTNCSLNTSIEQLVPKESIPTISISDLTLTEGSTANLQVSLSKVSKTDVVIPYQTVQLTSQTNATTHIATSGTDFTALNGSLTIPAGQMTGNISIDVLEDAWYEGGESFQIQLTAPVNAKLSSKTSTLSKIIYITDNEAIPTLQFANASDSVLESVVGGVKSIDFVLSGTCEYPVTFTFSEIGGTANLT